MITAHPKMVHFDYTACCALREGFRKNPAVVSFLTSFIPPASVAMHRDILTHTLNLGIIPNAEAAEVFSFVADAEKARLWKQLVPDNTFNPDCGTCTAEQHMKALEKVLKMLNPQGRA